MRLIQILIIPNNPYFILIKHILNHYKTYTTRKICMMRKITEKTMKKVVKKVLIAYLELYNQNANTKNEQ